MIKEELPVGFAMSLAMDTKALENYAKLSEEKKKQLIEESKQRSSREAMEQLVHEISENKYK